jgi:hypothetical protein
MGPVTRRNPLRGNWPGGLPHPAWAGVLYGTPPLSTGVDPGDALPTVRDPVTSRRSRPPWSAFIAIALMLAGCWTLQGESPSRDCTDSLARAANVALGLTT